MLSLLDLFMFVWHNNHIDKSEFCEEIEMLVIALLLNVVIVLCEVYVLGHIKKKINILKYYTYLQNLFGFLSSMIMIVGILREDTPEEYAKGFRYIATCGLVATTFIFVTFLGAGKKVALTDEDFLSGCTAKTANTILHYLCPALALMSFVFFEREINLSNGIWTSLAAAPSCVYWIMYAILSATKLWEEPYRFDYGRKNGKLFEVLTYILIPLSFIAISFVLWTVK